MRFLVALALIAVVVVACILASDTSGAVLPRAPRTVAPCATRDLTASLGGGAGAGMSQLRTGLELRNVGQVTCSLFGYPGVSWVARGGAQVGPAATRAAIPAHPSRVTLRPGATASAWLDIVQGDGGLSTATCHPRPARGLRVYPPGQRTALFVRAVYEGRGPCSARTRASLLGAGAMRPGVVPGDGGRD